MQDNNYVLGVETYSKVIQGILLWFIIIIIIVIIIIIDVYRINKGT